MNSVLSDLDYVFVYMDDVVIASKLKEEHRQYVNEVFRRMDKHSITINLAKCEFGRSQIEFLGYLITPNGYQPLPEKVEVITK